MDTAVTIKDLIIFLLGVGGFVLIIFLIVAVKHLIDTLKSTSKILKDVEDISAIASERAKDVDGIIDNIAESVGNVSKNLKGRAGIAQVVSAVVGLVTSLKGLMKNKKSSETAKKEKGEGDK